MAGDACLLYPINLRLQGRACLVVGGGPVAARKVAGLLAAGARVTVIARQLGDEVRALAAPELTLREEPFDLAATPLGDYCLIIAATNCPQLNRKLADAAAARNLPLNIVDQPEFCSFYVPSVINAGDLQLTISTNGKCPALSKHLRRKLEQLLPTDMAAIVDRLGNYRAEVVQRDISEAEKKALLEQRLHAELDGKL